MEKKKIPNEDNTSSKCKLTSSLYIEFIQVAQVSEFTNKKMQLVKTDMRK